MNLDLDNVATLRILNGDYLYTLTLGTDLIWQADSVSNPAISAPIAGNVTMSCATTATGTNIYYTLNGNDPTESSTHYTGSFKPLTACTIKAKAFNHNGYFPSGISKVNYTPTSDDLILTIPIDSNIATVSNIQSTTSTIELYEGDNKVCEMQTSTPSGTGGSTPFIVSIDENNIMTVENIDEAVYLLKVYIDGVFIRDVSV